MVDSAAHSPTMNSNVEQDVSWFILGAGALAGPQFGLRYCCWGWWPLLRLVERRRQQRPKIMEVAQMAGPEVVARATPARLMLTCAWWSRTPSDSFLMNSTNSASCRPGVKRARLGERSSDDRNEGNAPDSSSVFVVLFEANRAFPSYPCASRVRTETRERQ